MKLGEQLYIEMSALFPDVTNMCLTYDTVSVVKEAINYLIAIGDNYDDNEALGRAMRLNRITGCLGTIVFSSDITSRSSGKMLMQQYVENNQTREMMFRDVALISWDSSQVVEIIGELMWGSENNTIPGDLRPIELCPFDPWQKVQSAYGKNALYLVSGIVFGISFIVAIYSAKTFKENYNVLYEKKIISYSDFMF